MSRLIDEDIYYFNNKLNQKYQQSYNKSQSYLSSFPFKHQLKNNSFQYIAFDQITFNTQKCLKILVTYKKKLFSTFDIWYNLVIDDQNILKQEKLMISKEQFIFQITNNKKKLLALQIINSIKKKDLNFCKIFITNQGIINIQMPRFLQSNTLINSIQYYKKPHKSVLFCTYIETLIALILEDSKHTLIKIFQNLTNIQINQLSGILKQNEIKYKKLQIQLYRCLARIPIQLNLDYSQSSRVYTKIVDITMKQQQQVKQRLKIMNGQYQFKLEFFSLYVNKKNIFQDKINQIFFFTQPQKQVIKALLQIPQIIPQKLNNFSCSTIATENKYLLNQILLDSSFSDLKYLTQGGFGSLQYGNFNFWYIKSQKIKNNESEIYYDQNQKIINKYIIIKSPKFINNQSYLQKNYTQKYLFKHQHQFKIIKKLKGLSCIFFPRYYQVQDFLSNYKNKFISESQKIYKKEQNQIKNQNQQQKSNELNKRLKKIKNSILIQLTNFHNQVGYNLRNFMQQRFLTISLKKKVFIVTQLAQALRFLHQNKIIHLDLKPQNILIMKNFSIKIIDFGQAYHPEVGYKNTRPGYTYPYGCPQIAQYHNFSQQDLQFSQKSDVFSFGIILYQFLYDKDLLTISPQILLNQFKNRSYMNKIFVVHEQNQQYGQKIVLPILNYLIFKCIQTNPQDRPSMTWITILLKYIFQIFS